MGAAEELWAGRAQLHSFAGAEEVEGSLLLGYVEQAAKKVQDALTSVQESEMAVQARYAYWCSSPVSSPPHPVLFLRLPHRDCGSPSLPRVWACLSLCSFVGPFLGTVAEVRSRASSPLLPPLLLVGAASGA